MRVAQLLFVGIRLNTGSSVWIRLRNLIRRDGFLMILQAAERIANICFDKRLRRKRFT